MSVPRASIFLLFTTAFLSSSSLGQVLSPTAPSGANPLKTTAQGCKDDAAASKPVHLLAYTVELKTTSVQTLANGTTITRDTTEIHAVDSQSRNYRLHMYKMPFGEQEKTVTSAFVDDPVEGTQINWNTDRAEAHVLKLPPQDQRHGCWASDSGNMRMSYGPVQSAFTASTGVGGGLASSSASGTRALGTVGTRVTLPHPVRQRPVTEDLGVSTIEGVEVHGYRTTNTIPAGQIGNDQPLVTTSERWIAPSLGIALRSVNDDPRNGKSTTEVVRLDLSEPPLSTFQPPEGYKIITEELHQIPCAEPGVPLP